MQNVISFWRTSLPYGEFSNFYFSPIVIDGKDYDTVEHYFQSQKFLEEELQEKVRTAKTPKDAASIGRDRKYPLRQDWELVKETIMKRGLVQKFLTHKNLKELLLSTADSFLVEDSPYDYYWGCGKDNSGKNRLGVLLMEIREKFLENNINDVFN